MVFYKYIIINKITGVVVEGMWRSKENAMNYALKNLFQTKQVMRDLGFRIKRARVEVKDD